MSLSQENVSPKLVPASGRLLAKWLSLVSQEAERLQGSRVQRLAQTLPFHEWVRRTYLWIDREFFSFKDFKYLEPIYRAFPSTPEESA